MPGHILEAPQAAFNAEESMVSKKEGMVGSINNTQCSIFGTLFLFKFVIKCIEAYSLQLV